MRVEGMDELLRWVPGMLAAIVASVVLLWVSARDRWRATTTTVTGEGAYRSHATTTLASPRFPKRIAALSTLTIAWGVLTFLFATAGFLFVLVIASSGASAVFVGLVSCSGVLFGISSLVLASRLIRRSERAPRTLRWYAAFGIVHHIVVPLAFASLSQGIAEVFPMVLIPCAIGIGVVALVGWGAPQEAWVASEG